MQRASLWNYGFTGAVGGLTLGLLATPNPTSAGVATILAMAAAGAALQCWSWWTSVRPRDQYVRQQLSGRCAECGYDLTGNVSGVCPECGTRRAS